MSGSDSLGASGDFDSYATLALAAAGQTSARPLTRQIRCDTAGTLVVLKAAGGGSVALKFSAGEKKDVKVIAIIEAGSSGCVPIEVLR